MDVENNGVVERENLTPALSSGEGEMLPHPDPLLEERENGDLTPALSSGEGETQPHPDPLLKERENSTPTLAELVKARLAVARQKRLDAVIEENARDMARYETLVEAMPTLWEKTGLLGLLGAGTMEEDAEQLSVLARGSVCEIDVVVALYLPREQFADGNPWFGLRVSSSVDVWDSPTEFYLSGPRSLVEKVVGIVAQMAYKARVLRPKARTVIARSKELAAGWQAWDDACRHKASDVMFQRWEPVEMWSVTCGMLNLLGEMHGKRRNKKVVALESPADIARQLRDGRPALLTVVTQDGQSHQVWAFAVSEIERVEDMSPTIEHALEYHRSYQVGNYWVNLPVTLPANIEEEIDLASHKNGLWDEVPRPDPLHAGEGVKSPAGEWDKFCSLAGVVFKWADYWTNDWDETYWPKTLATMSVDEVVEKYADDLGWKSLKDGAL